MEELILGDVAGFVNQNIVIFHENKLKILQNLNLKKILRSKNPYLFKAKNLIDAHDLVKEILDAFLYSSEEKLFGDFLEDLSVFISGKTCNGRKSAAKGIDLEFVHNNINYLVSIKSGPNWGNSSQQNRQQQDFETAIRVITQSNHSLQVQPVLGICYGKTRTSRLRGYLKVVGQNFWYLISKNQNLYTDIVEPLGFSAREHNESFLEEKTRIVNYFTQKFSEDFCNDGVIDWSKLVKFNSGNFDLGEYYN